MKLNNKGFAITSVLYGLLLLFVFLVGSYLLVLTSKKNRLDTISADIDDKYGFNTETTIPTSSYTAPYTAPYTGKYVFTFSDSSTCTSYIKNGTDISDLSNVTFIGNCNRSNTSNIISIEVWYNDLGSGSSE